MPNTEKIRELNDSFRRSFVGGSIVVTRGVADRSDLPEIILRVRTFDAFNADNDPYGERDFGAFNMGDEQLFFKIDYYGLDMDSASSDPADPSVTFRVMTVMLAEEY